jgi:hypothetical protein
VSLESERGGRQIIREGWEEQKRANINALIEELHNRLASKVGT